MFGELPNAARNLVETRLNLVLIGTMPVFNHAGGVATIKVGAKPEKNFRIGDTVLKNVLLETLIV